MQRNALSPGKRRPSLGTRDWNGHAKKRRLPRSLCMALFVCGRGPPTAEMFVAISLRAAVLRHGNSITIKIDT